MSTREANLERLVTVPRGLSPTPGTHAADESEPPAGHGGEGRLGKLQCLCAGATSDLSKVTGDSSLDLIIMRR